MARAFHFRRIASPQLAAPPGRRTNPHAIITDDGAVAHGAASWGAAIEDGDRSPCREIVLSEITEADGREFLEYWTSKRRGHEHPRPAHLRPADCEALPRALHVHLRGRRWGARVLAAPRGRASYSAVGGDPTGRCLLGFGLAARLRRTYSSCASVWEQEDPVAAEGSYHWRGRAFIEWQLRDDATAPRRSAG